MFIYKMNTKHSNKVEHHIVGHIYEDTQGKLYLFLGRGNGSTKDWYQNSDWIGYLYLRIHESKSYMKNIYNLNEIFENMKNKKKSFYTYISKSEKPKNFVIDHGKCYDYSDSDFLGNYTKDYITEHKVSNKLVKFHHIDKLNLDENKKYQIEELDYSNICDLETLINNKKNKEKTEKEETLKKCPFCGNDKTLYKNWINNNVLIYKVGCNDCNIFFSDNDKKKVILKWNTRK